ncbi:MAG: Adenylate kinase [Berkelbacteria bacterium GW2011_GWA2_46_7]|uniref:Adenylate kinase n=1 Tax=Berkelbacteria bacterium GW2011_GWA2_46_7 TaxID=1618335 RepID=A0A0G1QDJ1_9BACT|nr:MAG: Adenylate kinase [Berkelbacteria bacterium GW2011_GWA2_46_7]
MPKKSTIFVVFGPQGSGKSTQVERLATRLDYKVFEAGEVLRKNSTTSSYIFDGYPRNLNQFDGFMKLVKKYDWQVAGIFINLSNESAKIRLSTRFQIIDGQKVMREDDKPDVVGHRLDVFKKETLPLKNKFKENYQLLEIDGEPPVDEVTTQISMTVDRFLDVGN